MIFFMALPAGNLLLPIGVTKIVFVTACPDFFQAEGCLADRKV
jgi:hypothetical protein